MDGGAHHADQLRPRPSPRIRPAIAVANKMARIVWAVWKFGKPFESQAAG